MSINFRKLVLSVLFASLVASSAQAASHHFGGSGHSSGLRSAASRVSNKLTQSGGATQSVRRQGLSTMDVIKAKNAASDLKSRVSNHRFSPSTMDVIKAKNLASDVKTRVLSHQFTPSTMDVIKAKNALGDVKDRVLNR